MSATHSECSAWSGCVAPYKPVQVRVLPAKCCLQDLMYLAQSQGAPELESTPNLRLAANQLHANLQNRVLSSSGPGTKFVHATNSFRPGCPTTTKTW
jgi:hypothetical protein